MDSFDRQILLELQRDSSQPISEIAERVNLSLSACHRRIKLLEDAAVIDGYMARLDKRSLGLEVDVFVEISLTSQSQETLDFFEKAVMTYDEILECHLTTGNADYIMRVTASDVRDYDRIHRNCLAKLPHVASMRSIFALRAIKPWKGYPVFGNYQKAP
ncbi:Lrp/AsnC family transcriptional regulator [uncultured Sneathiella sp.]|jgi:DNA-binding Lrp family transcriptional regulator|uniref:Lrp/AsnC family transcriptional regulator n=1 Tax=uncultured Sneathiella sp. TaxID=879315 RepID=UPI0030DCA7EF|tara:strand:- start:35160 stop:35636 length:477 start_codon:yes stop_codon:yes gene_type:complete